MGNRNLDPASPGGSNAPELGRAAVAQQRTGTGGEDCRIPPPALAQIRASDGEDTAMYAVQTAALNPVIDGAVAVPVLMKLCPRDNSMLETSQSPHVRTPPGRSVCEFLHHDPGKATQMADSPPVPGLVAPFGAGFG